MVTQYGDAVWCCTCVASMVVFSMGPYDKKSVASTDKKSVVSTDKKSACQHSKHQKYDL
jgi:hypothetical protein